jgi:hypothetical protein
MALLCNVPSEGTASSATTFRYTGGLLTAGGAPLTNPGNWSPVYIGGGGTCVSFAPGGWRWHVLMPGVLVEPPTWQPFVGHDPSHPGPIRPQKGPTTAPAPPAAVPQACPSTSAAATPVLSSAKGQPSGLASPAGRAALVLRPSGRLDVLDLATNQTRHTVAGPFGSGCQLPLKLHLLPSGALVLRDKKGTVLWSSQSACLCEPGCYRYSVSDLGKVVIQDSAGVQVWSMPLEPPQSARGPDALAQLPSGAGARSCITGGQRLQAEDGSGSSLVLGQDGALQLLDGQGSTLLWGSRAPGGRAAPPFKLCMGGDGRLQVRSGGGLATWSSTCRSNPAAPFTAMVFGGQLQVRRAACCRGGACCCGAHCRLGCGRL